MDRQLERKYRTVLHVVVRFPETLVPYTLGHTVVCRVKPMLQKP